MTKKPRNLTEENPETEEDLEERDLVLDEGQVTSSKPKTITEDLPQGVGNSGSLLTEG